MNQSVNRHVQAMTESSGLPLSWCHSDSDGADMLQSLAAFLKEHHVADVSYGAAFRSDSPHDRLLQRKLSLPYSIVTSLDEKTLDAYLAGPAKNDEVWPTLSRALRPLCVNHGNVRNLQQDRASLFWSYLNVSGRVVIPVRSSHDKYWFKFFVLYLNQATEPTDKWFNERKEWLEPLLNRASHVLSFDTKLVSNPFLKLDIISNTCREIMLLTSQGLSVKQVAEQVGLSQEGVTYHITRVKRLFGAKNKTQLIAALCHSQVI